MTRSSRLLALLLAAFAAPAASAQAAWFPGEAIDGPSPDVLSVADVDLAREGTGAVVYLRREGGTAHVFMSRLVDGAWRPPERVDTGLDAPATAAAVASGDGMRLAVAFVSGGRLYASHTPGDNQIAPLSAPQLLSDGPATSPSVDLGINGTAYLTFATGGDVRAARLEASTWEAIGAPLDVEPARTAGDGTGRPRVAVSAEGNAVATWGEDGADGRRRIFARRLTGLVPSVAPQEVSLPDFAGAPGGPADAPDIDIEDDGSYAWISFRQEIGGAPRALSRRLVGSLFEAPAALDGGVAAAAPPAFSMNGRGIGVSVLAGPDNTVLGADLTKFDAYQTFYRVDGGGSEAAPAPAVAISERRQVGVAWRRTSGGVASVQARYRPDEKPYEPETTVSNPAFGSVADGPEIGASKSGDFAAAFVQAAGVDRRLVVSVFDKPPAAPVGRSTDKFQRRPQPRLKWGVGGDLWGAQTFKVFIDDVEVATTNVNEVDAPAPLPDGAHRWRVTAIDRRGQVTPSRDRLLRIDTAAPRVRVRVTGARRRGAALRVTVRPSDPRGGSGIKAVSVDYGDRTAKALTRRSTHRYARGGRFRLRVRVADRAGNVTRKTIRLRIRR